MAEQLTIAVWLQRHLVLGGHSQSPIDEKQLEQAEALDAIRAAAADAGKEPCDVTAREFDHHAPPGWTWKRVRRAFGRWQTATDALRHGRQRLTTEQRTYLQQVAGRDHGFELPLVSVKKFVDSEPVAANDDLYNEWARKENLAGGGKLRWHLSSSSILYRLGIPWSLVVRVARGELSLAEAQATRRTGNEKPTWMSEEAAHDLIDRRDVARILGKDRQQARRLENNAAFPKPVLVLGDTRAWIRADIEAVGSGTPVPRREWNELRSQYLTSEEVAAALDVTVAALRQPNAHAPKPTGAICGKKIWHRAAVDKWLAETPISPYSGRARARRRVA